MARGSEQEVSLRRTRYALALAALLVLIPCPAVSQSARSAPLLLGGEAPAAPREVTIDPRLPSGERRSRLGPFSEDSPSARSDSARFPISVSAPSSRTRRRALALLERAYERVWLTSGAAPRLGGLHWHITARPPAGESLPVVREQRDPSLGFDRTRIDCLGGSLSDAAAQSCALEGAILGVAPATTRTLLRGYSTFSRFKDAAASMPRELSDQSFRKHPGRPIVSREAALMPQRASALFFAAFAERAGKSTNDPGFLALTLAATKTDPGSLRWNAEPDLLDVVRTSLGEDRESYARFFDRLGAARFAPLPALAEISELQGGFSKPAWTIAFDSLPRNLTLTDPLWPTGSVAFELTSPSPIETPIAFRISCESPVTYAWSIVRLDEHGQFLSHFPIPYKENSSHYDQRVEPAGARSLLLIGTNLGGVDLDHPYDPDHSPHEPHGCSVYIAKSP